MEAFKLEVTVPVRFREGNSIQVAFDYKNNKKVPVPENVKDRILEFEGRENVTVRGASGA